MGTSTAPGGPTVPDGEPTVVAAHPKIDPRDRSPGGDPRELVKRSLRELAVVTSPMRVLPDFLLIGAKRAATTTLWDQVASHPGVPPLFPARLKIKGTRFFSTNFHRGVGWYRSFFPTRMTMGALAQRLGYEATTGEATPYYLFHPHAPNRVRDVVPDARLIAILRNPVDRAYSHYRERVRHGVEPLSFEDALAAEGERVRDAEQRLLANPSTYDYAHEHFTYVEQGRYAAMFERWFAAFERSRFLVVVNERFDADPDAELERVWTFLGLPSWTPPRRRRLNFHPGEPMAAATRERLLEAFAEDNRRLEQLLDLDLSIWSA